MCEKQGKLTLATVCDHIEPHKGDTTKFYAGPFQSLCASHHNSSKQREEKSGVMVGGFKDGTPIDPLHHWNT